MLRNTARFVIGTALTVSMLSVSTATSQTATADELNVVSLTDTTAAASTSTGVLERSGGLVSFVRGITLPAGPGHRSGPVKFGIWNARGYGHGFKIEFTPHHGVPSNGNVPGMNTEDSRCTKTIDSRYKNASRSGAFSASVAILRKQNEAPFRRYYRWAVRHHKIAKSQVQSIQGVLDKCKHHSPFHASMQTNMVYFGQKGHGTTTVSAANGLTAPAGLHVQTAGTGTSIVDAATQLNSRGIAGFLYRLISYTGGSVQSTVTGPDATRADLLVTPDGNTRLLVNSYKATATASSKIRQKVLPKPTVTTSNPYASTGMGKVKVVAKVPASAASPVRWTARNAGKNHRMYVRPGRSHHLTFSALDSSKVTLSYCYVKRIPGTCSSPTHTYGGTPEVVAPAWIVDDGSYSCCTKYGTTISSPLLFPEGSKRFYRASVLVNGKVVQTVDVLSSGGAVLNDVTLKKGLVQVRFMAYRNSDYTGALFKQYEYVFNQTLN